MHSGLNGVEENEMSRFAKKLIEENTFEIPQNKLTEKYTNVEEQSRIPLPATSKDNLHYYKVPADPEYFPKRNVKAQENFTVQEITCEDYVKHALDCSKCRLMLMKSFNIEQDRLHNEEMMEVASYVLFGIFVLFLIDALKKK